MKDCVLHGEVFIHRASNIPEGAKKKAAPLDCYVVAKSETTGNNHIIDCNDGVEFYEHEGTLYMKNTKETQVRCVHKDRHDELYWSPLLR